MKISFIVSAYIIVFMSTSLLVISTVLFLPKTLRKIKLFVIGHVDSAICIWTRRDLTVRRSLHQLIILSRIGLNIHSLSNLIAVGIAVRWLL